MSSRCHKVGTQFFVLLLLVILFTLLAKLKGVSTPIKIDGLLLTTETLNTKEHQIIFKRVGEYAPDVQFHHVHIPVNLGKQVNIAKEAKQIILQYAHNIYQETLMQYHQDNKFPEEEKAKQYANLLTIQNIFVINNTGLVLNQIEKSLISIIKALPHINTRLSERQLRILFGLAGTAFATANSIRITQLQTRGNTRFTSLTHIADICQNHMEHMDIQILANQKKTLEMLRYNPATLLAAANQLIFQALDVSNKVQATIQEAQHSRLSTQLLQGETVNKMYHFLDQAAKTKGMELLITKSVDLFQIELSYFYREEDQILNLFLHVPIVFPNSILQLYQLVPFPIASDIRENSSMVAKVEQDMIAVGSEHQFQIVSHSDLTSCNKYGSVYFCEDRHTIGTKLEATCIGALYMERWPKIHKLCKFKFVQAEEYVFRLAANQWIISSPEPFSTAVKCNKVFHTINLKQLSIVTVPEGCVMHLREHIIQPGNFILDSVTDVKHFQWPWKPDEIFPRFNTKAFNETLNSLSEEISLTIDYINQETKLRQNSDDSFTQSIREEIQNIKEQNDIHPNITLYILISFIISAIIITIVLFKLYCNSIKASVTRHRCHVSPHQPTLNAESQIQEDYKEYNTPMEHMTSATTDAVFPKPRTSTLVTV